MKLWPAFAWWLGPHGAVGLPFAPTNLAVPRAELGDPLRLMRRLASAADVIRNSALCPSGFPAAGPAVGSVVPRGPAVRRTRAVVRCPASPGLLDTARVAGGGSHEGEDSRRAEEDSRKVVVGEIATKGNLDGTPSSRSGRRRPSKRRAIGPARRP
jgi:hypothetical protein